MSPNKRRPFPRHMPIENDKEVKDWRLVPGKSPSIDLSDFEFLISIRQSWLPLRMGGRAMILEVYSPHRFAHQFGYDQVIPGPGLARSALYPDLKTLSLCWFSLLRVGTGASFVIPRLSRPVMFSAGYHRWFRKALMAGVPLSHSPCHIFHYLWSCRLSFATSHLGPVFRDQVGAVDWTP